MLRCCLLPIDDDVETDQDSTERIGKPQSGRINRGDAGWSRDIHALGANVVMSFGLLVGEFPRPKRLCVGPFMEIGGDKRLVDGRAIQYNRGRGPRTH